MERLMDDRSTAVDCGRHPRLIGRTAQADVAAEGTMGVVGWKSWPLTNLG